MLADRDVIDYGRCMYQTGAFCKGRGNTSPTEAETEAKATTDSKTETEAEAFKWTAQCR